MRTSAAQPKHAGLTRGEAARRLIAEGYNDLPAAQAPGVARAILSLLAEPMFLLLCAAVGLYVLLGNVREALVLASSLVVVVTITVLQERRSERALAALRELSSPRAAVMRDGELQRIAGREVVRGDIALLSEGDRVPADGLLREATDLMVDESLLTGEAAPVSKHAEPQCREMSRPHAESHGCVYSGTLVVHGHGIAEIAAIGAATEIGRIGHALELLQPQRTPLYRETRHIVQWLAVCGILLCLAVVVLYALSRGDWIAGSSRRNHARHERPAGRVSGRAHGVPGAGRLASVQAQRFDAQDAGDRNAGRRHGAGGGQDWHAHGKPHDGGGIASGNAAIAPRCRGARSRLHP